MGGFHRQDAKSAKGRGDGELVICDLLSPVADLRSTISGVTVEGVAGGGGLAGVVGVSSSPSVLFQPLDFAGGEDGGAEETKGGTDEVGGEDVEDGVWGGHWMR